MVNFKAKFPDGHGIVGKSDDVRGLIICTCGAHSQSNALDSKPSAQIFMEHIREITEGTGDMETRTGYDTAKPYACQCGHRATQHDKDTGCVLDSCPCSAWNP